MGLICGNPKCRFHVLMPPGTYVGALSVRVLKDLKPKTAFTVKAPVMEEIPVEHVTRHPYCRGGKWVVNPSLYLCDSCHGAVEMMQRLNDGQ